jgi:outer membrane scaffolding protein for murein synthesis (MipA/OmpV family)
MKPITTLVAAGLLAAAGATSSLAEDNTFDVAFGVGVANNYISRGASQSSDQPIIDGYMEATYGIVYGGVL